MIEKKGAIYVIGDVQGCDNALGRLLDCIQYDDASDQLWFTGDLVNRGENSLGVLRRLKNLHRPPIIVLGNHDLHLLNVYYHRHQLTSKDTLLPLLNAEDVDELCEWLRFQPLLHVDESLHFILVHAGILPAWDKATALQMAQEVETQLQSDQVAEFFSDLYGNQPACWSPHLSNKERWRFILNSFTRMRFCASITCLNLSNKTAADEKAMPWFKMPHRATQQERILFGHWSALMGKTDTPNVYALDTGCVWGGQLTAMRLNDMRLFQVNA